MMALHSLAAFPVALHLLTGIGVLGQWGSLQAEEDSLDWWIATTLNCFKLWDGDDQLRILVAWIHIITSVVAMATLFSPSLKIRRIGYGLLLAIFGAIQIRHVLMGQGPESIGFLFTHIFIYATLVLHNERTCTAS